MAEYTGKTGVHETLTATSVDRVDLSEVRSGAGVQVPTVTVVNRTGGAEIYFTVSATAADPADPTVKGANTYVLPAAIGSVSVPVYPGVMGNSAVVKLISSGAEEYSVEAL